MILHDLISYEVLRVIWWLLLGVLLIGFAVTDGFDLGTATLLPFVGRNDVERRVVVNTIGPVWEGNQVWLVLGGGAIFAAWPAIYAVSFSGFYLAMFAVLFALILRPVGFKYRSKRESATWRTTWDWLLFVGGFVPSLIFGVALGNVLQGVPFRLDSDLRIFYDGSFFGLLNPFAILTGLVSVAMLVMHGASYLATKTDGVVQARARSYGSVAALALIVLFALAGVWLYYGIDGYAFTGAVDAGGPSNPLMNDVARQQGAWFVNYGRYPWMMLAPALGFLGALGAFIGFRGKKPGLGMISSGLSVFGIVATPGVAMFPFLLPSSTQPAASLTAWDASSSQLTLFIMLVCALIFVPIILAYTSWVYHIMWGKVTNEDVTNKDRHAY
ncbi:cytochrome d ubiquinol oxidase subunit II [Martelella endophytica]|uniref:Cytochrome d ubiquinol oxidase subunit 2 n=1 Tax=Martelella endophytica TaxID=1486262 RepID=A0A0D5LKP3_MAREN|nr:cytochrome d ubiquinol oxidase subunit II [Martelella endophytica]AJY44774.1 cytochrome d ubiquinol oxidase subunit 2 [Martelella endophytica]